MRSWKELQSEVTPEVDQWVRGFLAASNEMIEAQRVYIEAQRVYIEQLELKLLDHGDLEIVKGG